MSAHHRVVAILVRLYPRSWRREYGAELEHLLLARPLDRRTVADVIWNGCRQRLRLTEPGTYLGLLMMTVVAYGVAQGLVTPSPDLGGFAAILERSGKTLPVLVVTPIDPLHEPYVLLLLLGGCWTNVRYGGRIARAARAGATMTLLGGMPVVILGLFMFTGVFEVSAGLALATLVAPLFAVPLSMIWGAVGGQVGRRISYLRRRLARS